MKDSARPSFKQGCKSGVFYHFACWPRLIFLATVVEPALRLLQLQQTEKPSVAIRCVKHHISYEAKWYRLLRIRFKKQKRKRSRKLQKQRLSKCLQT